MKNRNHILTVLTASAVLLFATGSFAAGCWAEAGASDPPDDVREIVLEAEDGEFVRKGETNPTLRVEKGETVRLVFRNTDSGVHHALSVPPFVESSHEVSWGEEASVTFTPDRTGTFTYRCNHHVPIMEGELVVRPSSSSARVAQRENN